MNNEVGERFLPLGSIVLLKGATKKLMITSYCIIPKGKVLNSKGEVVEVDRDKTYDYGACTYPEGIISNEVAITFNHDMIDKVIYLGYSDKEGREFSDFCNQKFEEYKKNLSDKKEEGSQE